MALTEAKKAAIAKWDAVNLKRMSLAVPVTLHTQMAEHIQGTHETMNGFIRRAIEETIERDKQNQ